MKGERDSDMIFLSNVYISYLPIKGEWVSDMSFLSGYKGGGGGGGGILT